jgi:lipopolysaccharide/colanic/teichoic acid biosynthesis glycosyltransferase
MSGHVFVRGRSAGPRSKIGTVLHHILGKRADRRLLVLALVGIDTLSLIIGIGGAGLLRLRLEDVFPVSSLATERHLLASLMVVPGLLVLLSIEGLYDIDRILTGTREYNQIVHAVTYGVLIALAASYFAGGGPVVSRTWLLLVWTLGIGCVGVGRFGFRRVVRWLRRRGTLRTRVAIVGASSVGVAIAAQLRAARDEGLDVVGFLDEYLQLGEPLLDDVAVVGRPSDLLRQPPLQLADEYILVPQALPFERQEEISYLMMSRDGPTLRIAVSSSDLLTHGVMVTERGSVPLITLRRARLRGLEVVLKGGLDRVLAALALVLLAPLAAAAVLRGCLRGHHPLCRQYSIYGAEDRQITLHLFDAGLTTSLLLRGLPALLAVLTGDLSLVGPRPTLRQPGNSTAPGPSLAAVKPGLTGPWRLSGPQASLAYQAIQDLTYVRNYSIWDDVRILSESLHRLRANSLASLLGRWQDSGTGELIGPDASSAQTELPALLAAELIKRAPQPLHIYPGGRHTQTRTPILKGEDTAATLQHATIQAEYEAPGETLRHREVNPVLVRKQTGVDMDV